MDIKEIIFDLIDDHTKGVDTYNHNGSTWLIFTDSKKWVIELTKEKTLWYNYYFFNNIFKYLSLGVVENQHYITKWVEDTVINGVKETRRTIDPQFHSIEDTIQNGVKSIKGEYYKEIQKVEYTIENGVKYTIDIEDAIQNGVKKTRRNGDSMNTEVEDAIQNGVKSTQNAMHWGCKYIESVIQNGVKDTFNFAVNPLDLIEDAIQNGVKRTVLHIGRKYAPVEDTIQNGVKNTLPAQQIISAFVEDTIQNGVKHNEYGDWEDGDERLDNIIENGQIKTTVGGCQKRLGVKDTIQNGVKDTKNRLQRDFRVVEDAIQNGVKHTQGSIFDNPTTVKDTIQNGVKNTYSDKIPHEYDWSDQFTEEIDNIVQNGIKEIKSVSNNMVDVLKTEGKIVYADDYTQDFWVDTVVEKGIKETYMAKDNNVYDPHTFTTSKQVRNERINDVIENGIIETKSEVATREWKAGEVIDNGVKEVKELPDQSGELRGYGDYYRRQDDMTKPHTLYVNDVINGGIKETVTGSDKRMLVENVLNNGIKLT